MFLQNHDDVCENSPCCRSTSTPRTDLSLILICVVGMSPISNFSYCTQYFPPLPPSRTVLATGDCLLIASDLEM